MKLYFNKWRFGTDVQTFFKPKEEVEPEIKLGELQKAGFEDRIWELMAASEGMTYVQASKIMYRILRLAIYTFPYSAVARPAFIKAAMAQVAWSWNYGWIIPVALLVGVPILITVILLGTVQEIVEQRDWGHKWTMRFNEQFWDAEFYEIDRAGRYWFRRRDPYRGLIVAEGRNVTYAGFTGDAWDLESTWIEQEKIGLIWHNFHWSTAVLGWVGMCDRWTDGLYVLQDPFVGNLPML